MTTPETEECNPDCRAQWENWKKENHIQVWKAGELPVRFRMQGLSLSVSIISPSPNQTLLHGSFWSCFSFFFVVLPG